MRILAVDSSAVSASCAVVEDGRVLASAFTNTSLTHSQTLLPMIEDMLNNSRILLDSIDLFAVNVGPGSFTGVRIGIATIKGMAFARNIPCVAVSTLDAIALGGKYPVGHYTVMTAMDARCSQVYNSVYENDGEKFIKKVDDRAIKLCDLEEEIKNSELPIIFVGDGADLCYNYFLEKHGNILPTRSADKYQNAVYTAFIAEGTNKDEYLSAEALEVKYLRMPQAERERLEKEKKQ